MSGGSFLEEEEATGGLLTLKLRHNHAMRLPQEGSKWSQVCHKAHFLSFLSRKRIMLQIYAPDFNILALGYRQIQIIQFLGNSRIFPEERSSCPEGVYLEFYL